MDIRNAWRLDDSRILIEQLRLIYGNVGSTATPAILCAMLVTVMEMSGPHWAAVLLWCVAVTALKLYTGWDARRRLAGVISPAQAPRLVVRLVVLNGIDGALWGGLAWIIMDNHSPAQTALVGAITTGILANSVSMLAPVLQIFVAYIAGMMILMVSKLWLMDGTVYNVLGAASVLYLISLVGQARNSARTLRAYIELRFENVGLIREADTARREAEEANLAKSKFLAAASHDLRQPVHAQGMFLDVLARTDLTAYQREVLESARSASWASSEMLNTLLDFSRIEAGVVQPHKRPFDLQATLQKIENDLAPLADVKGLVYRSRETTLTVDSDALLVELALRNLVSNAIRYTERGGVLVACRQRGPVVVVEVWDTGIGIAQTHLKDVFREFHQLGNPERDRRKGLGLGLAITKGLAEALAHPLSVASRPGKGSVFRLELPLTSAALAPGSLSLSFDLQLLRGIRVLVVDDDETVRLGMSHLLHSWGCVCDVAGTISEGLALARRQAPDVVVSDYRLREQHTGAEAITALRGLLGEETPALMITGDTAPDRLRETVASGVPLLHKPVAAEQLRQSLVELLNKRKARVEDAREHVL